MVHVIVFAKAPCAGKVKTRLMPALGAHGAAALARRLLRHTLAQVLEALPQTLELCASPAPGDKAWDGVAMPDSVVCSDQGEGDLGARMARAAKRALRQAQGVLLIGTDCPALTAIALRAAADELQHSDAVMIPAQDGGYVLLGLKRYDRALFENIPWSTPAVAPLTREVIQRLGWSFTLLEPLPDIDEPQDLRYLPADWQAPAFEEI